MKKLENKTGMSINLIIDELKSEDIRKRIHSVKNLALIASSIGPDRSRNELVPFLQGLILAISNIKNFLMMRTKCL
jgi:serine/threonine-protein phosphatase 2A regulatory subunit A